MRNFYVNLGLVQTCFKAYGDSRIGSVSKKILVVEDEIDIRAALVAWLEDEDFDVAEASDGIAGREEFDRFHPDIALLDMNMPGMNGIELCRSLRKVTQIPLIMFTAAADLDDVQKAISEGATDFVLKDTGLDELVRRITEHLHVERHSISKSELRAPIPAQIIHPIEPQSEGIGGTLTIGADGTAKTEQASPSDLWTWGGDYFGFRDGVNLWTYDGRHVGRFRRDEVFRKDGSYMGDLMHGRLVIEWHKTGRRASSFSPSDNRGGHRHFSEREPFDMLDGFKDFPTPDEC